MKAKLTKKQFITILRAQEIAYNLMRASDEEYEVECSYGDWITTQEEFHNCMSIIVGSIEELCEKVLKAELECNEN